MHVILRSVVVVKDSVDVFEVVSSSVLVLSVRFGVRTMEASSGGSEECLLLEYRSTFAHEHCHVCASAE